MSDSEFIQQLAVPMTISDMFAQRQIELDKITEVEIREALNMVRNEISAALNIPSSQINLRNFRTVMKSIQYGNLLLDAQEKIKFEKDMGLPYTRKNVGNTVNNAPIGKMNFIKES